MASHLIFRDDIPYGRESVDEGRRFISNTALPISITTQRNSISPIHTSPSYDAQRGGGSRTAAQLKYRPVRNQVKDDLPRLAPEARQAPPSQAFVHRSCRGQIEGLR